MDVNNITSLLSPNDIVQEFVYLRTVLGAIGGVIVVYIVFGIINFISNRKKQKELEKMRILLEKIERKLDKKKLS